MTVDECEVTGEGLVPLSFAPCNVSIVGNPSFLFSRSIPIHSKCLKKKESVGKVRATATVQLLLRHDDIR
eukprot:1188228-Prorocentrum_minimum.AAC.1